MVLYRLQNVFLQIAKCIYTSKLLNVFVQIAKCICPNLKINLSKFQNVFVQIAKCICQNLKIYLSKFQNVFVLIAKFICSNFTTPPHTHLLLNCATASLLYNYMLLCGLANIYINEEVLVKCLVDLYRLNIHLFYV